MSGITDVAGFSDTTVELSVADGSIDVDGENLKIESFSASTGKIQISGTVSSIGYYGKPLGGFFKKKRP